MKMKIMAMALMLFLLSCDDFLDINKDPNNPTTAQLNSILPYAEANIFGEFGIGTAGISETLEVYAHQIVQRGNQDDYKVQANEFSLVQTWDEMYTVALPDLNQIIKQGAEEGRPVYSGIAKILKAQVFSLMVDLWGDIPYSESGDPVKYKFPHFDDDAAIYADLFNLIDAGIADLDAGGAPPGSDDLVYGGDTDKWKAYAHSLKLNMYNKVRLTDLYDAAKVNALLNSTLISNESGDFELTYTTSITPENRNPGFIREYAQNNPQYYISPYFYLMLKGEQACQNTLLTNIPDPRLPYYFYNQLNSNEVPQNPVTYQDGNFLSIWFGSYDRDPNEGFDQNTSQTVCGLYPLGGAYDDGSGRTAANDSGLRGAGAQRMLTAAGVDYIRAELALTKATGEDPRALLETAIYK
ncbi:MAG TPA: SusD/RagB family nutrient-binding outer membrane lipoprotein, partial [Saprospiraceae bacterium]|nr:SusD/RagB family nutrient-binding outer membrane lipoprotein [Saprospiraceae bacterium]